MRRHVPLPGAVDHAGISGRRVDPEPFGRIQGALGAALQQIVGGDHRLTEISRRVVDALADLCRQIILIGLRDRLHDRPVGGHVRVEHGAIDRLRRVVVALLDRRGLRHGGAPGQHAREHGGQ